MSKNWYQMVHIYGLFIYQINIHLMDWVTWICILKFHPYLSDGGIMVSMVAFQAVDPGSIPGHRILHILFP